MSDPLTDRPRTGDPVIEGSVRNVRQLKAGWQADVIIGQTDTGQVTVQVVCKSEAVVKAARDLKRAIQVETGAVMQQAVTNGAEWARAVQVDRG